MATSKQQRFSRVASLEDVFRSCQTKLVAHYGLHLDILLSLDRPDGFLGRLATLILDAQEAKLQDDLVATWTTVLAAAGARTLAGGPEGARSTNEEASARKKAQIAEWIAYAKPLAPCPSHSAEAHRIHSHFSDRPKTPKLDTIRKTLPKRETW